MTTWIRLDGDFHRNPKLLVRSRDARWLYLASVGYCGEHETDGLIPRGVLGQIAPDLAEEGLLLEAAAELLEDVGGLGVLWETDPAGYRVHDFLEKNPSRAYFSQRRNAARAGGRARAEAPRSSSGRFSAAVDNAVEKPVENLEAPAGGQPGDQPERQPGDQRNAGATSRDQPGDQQPNQHDLRTKNYSSSALRSSLVPIDELKADISERQDPDPIAELLAAGIDDDVGYLIGKIARQQPRILDVSGAHVHRLQHELGVPVLRETFRRIADPVVLSGIVLSWPAYIDATARRVAEQGGASDG